MVLVKSFPKCFCKSIDYTFSLYRIQYFLHLILGAVVADSDMVFFHHPTTTPPLQPQSPLYSRNHTLYLLYSTQNRKIYYVPQLRYYNIRHLLRLLPSISYTLSYFLLPTSTLYSCSGSARYYTISEFTRLLYIPHSTLFCQDFYTFLICIPLCPMNVIRCMFCQWGVLLSVVRGSPPPSKKILFPRTKKQERGTRHDIYKRVLTSNRTRISSYDIL